MDGVYLNFTRVCPTCRGTLEYDRGQLVTPHPSCEEPATLVIRGCGDGDDDLTTLVDRALNDYKATEGRSTPG